MAILMLQSSTFIIIAMLSYYFWREVLMATKCKFDAMILHDEIVAELQRF